MVFPLLLWYGIPQMFLVPTFGDSEYGQGTLGFFPKTFFATSMIVLFWLLVAACLAITSVAVETAWSRRQKS